MQRRNGWLGVELTEAIIDRAKDIRAERDVQYGNIYPQEETDKRWLGDAGEILFRVWLRHHKVHPVEWIRDKA